MHNICTEMEKGGGSRHVTGSYFPQFFYPGYPKYEKSCARYSSFTTKIAYVQPKIYPASILHRRRLKRLWNFSSLADWTKQSLLYSLDIKDSWLNQPNHAARPPNLTLPYQAVALRGLGVSVSSRVRDGCADYTSGNNLEWAQSVNMKGLDWYLTWKDWPNLALKTSF